MRFRTDGIEFPNLAKGWAVPFPLTLIRRDWTLFFVGFRSWRKHARWARHKLNAAPPAIRIVVIAATVLAVVSVTNLVYQVVRKPTEMLFPVSGAMNKMPAETWQQHAPLFRELRNEKPGKIYQGGDLPTPGTLDPRPVVKELDATVPKDWDIIVAGGHCFSFAMTHLRGRPAGKYHIPIDFGAIGSGLPAAIGVAAARNNGKVLLIDGDGSLYQHIQELETVRRHGMKLLICIVNDGGYGAETHTFRAHGVDPMHATHGRGDLAQVARGFGLNGTKATSLGQFERLFREHQAQDDASLWDVHVDDLIPSRNFRRVHYGEA